jgi:hypothetical protein
MHTLKDRHDLLQELERISRENVVFHIIEVTPRRREREDIPFRGIVNGVALSAILFLPFVIAWFFGG